MFLSTRFFFFSFFLRLKIIDRLKKEKNVLLIYFRQWSMVNCWKILRQFQTLLNLPFLIKTRVWFQLFATTRFFLFCLPFEFFFPTIHGNRPPPFLLPSINHDFQNIMSFFFFLGLSYSKIFFNFSFIFLPFISFIHRLYWLIDEMNHELTLPTDNEK